MSTNSTITALCTDGTYKTIYCHWDGDIEGVGKKLVRYFYQQEKIESLMALGNISTLEERIDCPEGHSFENPVANCTVAYGRDRGGVNEEAKCNDEKYLYLLLHRNKQQYNYIWDGKEWKVIIGEKGKIEEAIPLGDLLI